MILAILANEIRNLSNMFLAHLIAPVANVLMRLGCQGKGTEDFGRQ